MGTFTNHTVRIKRLLIMSLTSIVFLAPLLSSKIALADDPNILSIIAGNGTSGTPTPGPATSSAFKEADGIAVDTSGNVYIVDQDNRVVEKVTPDGTLSIIAGTGTSGTPTPGPATSSNLAQPYGVNVDSSGNVYIADSSNNSIEKVTIPTTSTASLSNVVNSANVIVATPMGTNITCSTSVTETSLTKQDPGYSYPLGLVNLCFNTLNADNQVSLTFVTNLTASQVIARDFNTTTGAYTNVPGAVITGTTYNGQPALNLTYTVKDNGSLDSNSSIGSITDPIGLALATTVANSVGVPNTGLGGMYQPTNYIWYIAALVGLVLVNIRLFINNRKLSSTSGKK